MKPEKIQAVVEMYRRMFEAKNIPKARMSRDKTFGQATSEERLAHAHYLLDGVIEYSKMPGKEGKTGRHLTAVQMLLSFENWFTLGELMDHNRPDGS
jgi:hypothetical protein